MYSSYKGRCLGRVLHALYLYCGFNVAEYCRVDDKSVSHYGDFATYEWEGEDTPVFKFLHQKVCDHIMWYEWKQLIYKPLLNEPAVRYMNVEFIIQEVAKIDNSSIEDAKALMKKHSQLDEKYAEHIMMVAAKLRKLYDKRQEEINTVGHWSSDYEYALAS